MSGKTSAASLSNMDLKGQVALITGGASGLGEHLAHALHSQDVTLIIADINETAGIGITENFNKLRAGSAFFHKTDVTNWEDQVQLFKGALEQVKRIDYVFANAGVAETTYLPYTSTEKVEWVKPNMTTINVNVTGALYTSHLAAQVFRTQPVIGGFRGKIIVTGSAYSFTPGAYLPLYTTAKHGLVGFIRSFSMQLAPDSITVNGVAPNMTKSNMVQAMMDILQDRGAVTSNEKVTETFISFLGDCKDTGLIKEVSVDDILIRQAPEPINKHVTENLKLLDDIFKQWHAAPPKHDA